eukprot:COSAG06_NODE_17379_length_944_cov_27.444970_1_plen_146_part_00
MSLTWVIRRGAQHRAGHRRDAQLLAPLGQPYPFAVTLCGALVQLPATRALVALGAGGRADAVDGATTDPGLLRPLDNSFAACPLGHHSSIHRKAHSSTSRVSGSFVRSEECAIHRSEVCAIHSGRRLSQPMLGLALGIQLARFGR